MPKGRALKNEKVRMVDVDAEITIGEVAIDGVIELRTKVRRWSAARIQRLKLRVVPIRFNQQVCLMMLRSIVLSQLRKLSAQIDEKRPR
jgi:hypothetical protein